LSLGQRKALIFEASRGPGSIRPDLENIRVELTSLLKQFEPVPDTAATERVARALIVESIYVEASPGPAIGDYA
jgi:hypothetical protein